MTLKDYDKIGKGSVIGTLEIPIRSLETGSAKTTDFFVDARKGVTVKVSLTYQLAVPKARRDAGLAYDFYSPMIAHIRVVRAENVSASSASLRLASLYGLIPGNYKEAGSFSHME